MTHSDLIADYLARGGQVKKVAAGARTTDPYGQPSRGANRLAAVDHLGRETWVNSEGEVISHG